MLCDSKSYISTKSRKLTMLPEEIHKVVEATSQKERRIIATFEEALHIPVDYAIKISKPANEYQLSEWECDCPTAPDVFYVMV